MPDDRLTPRKKNSKKTRTLAREKSEEKLRRNIQRATEEEKA